VVWVFIYGREEDANGRGKEIWWDNVAKRKNEEDLHASHDEPWSRGRQREENERVTNQLTIRKE
jgi:hypothetical protein